MVQQKLATLRPQILLQLQALLQAHSELQVVQVLQVVCGLVVQFVQTQQAFQQAFQLAH